jgi:3'-5' exoribonuclease
MDDEPLARMYRLAPAAKHVHHAFLGGLIEHVLSLCNLARMLSTHYSYIDIDLLLTGVILHDVGKVAELTYDRSFGYSSEGQLVGHIGIGLRFLHEKLQRLPDFPPKLRVLVEHMILSHHGELEFGSPKLPQFPEALLLHHLDNLDSKMECMRALVAKDRLVEGYWTTYNASLERSVLKKAKYLEEVLTVPAPPAASAQPNLSAEPETSSHPVPHSAAPQTYPAQPHPPQGHPPQAHSPLPPAGSLFAEKLEQAWRKGS